MFTSSSSSEEDSEDDSEEDEESEEDSELLSLPESDSSFFLAATLGFLVFSSDESEDPESDSEDEAAAFYLIWVEGVDAAFWSFAASLAARASSSDQIGFSLNVASCFS